MMSAESNELPAPLVPRDLDLRKLPGMVLDVNRLLASDLLTMQPAEVVRYALIAWCVSWHEVPAGSLPCDAKWLQQHLDGTKRGRKWVLNTEQNSAQNDELASNYSRIRGAIRGSIRGALGVHWKLYGWILCSDGRLYHPAVCDAAMQVWQQHMAYKRRTENARKARWQAKEEKVESGTEQDNQISVTDHENDGADILSQGKNDSLLQPVRKGKERKGVCEQKTFTHTSSAKRSTARAPENPAARGVCVPPLAPDGDKPQFQKRNGHASLTEQAVDVLRLLNALAGRDFQAVDSNLDLIKSRLHDGATAAECKAVVAKKVRDWKNDPRMAQYLRPATLFDPMHWAQYRGELLTEDQIDADRHLPRM